MIIIIIIIDDNNYRGNGYDNNNYQCFGQNDNNYFHFISHTMMNIIIIANRVTIINIVE